VEVHADEVGLEIGQAEVDLPDRMGGYGNQVNPGYFTGNYFFLPGSGKFYYRRRCVV